MKDNVRVAWKPEHDERRKRPDTWASKDTGIQPFWNLYREIRNKVETQGGWPGKSELEVLEDDSEFSNNQNKDIDTSKIIPVIGENE